MAAGFQEGFFSFPRIPTSSGLQRPEPYWNSIMHSDPPQPSDPALTRLLNTWRVQSHLPAGFPRRVWLRLARIDGPGGGSIADALRHWLSDVFLRPTWSLGYALVLLGVGMLGGYLGAREQIERFHQHMEQRYVQSINPYFNPR
jgi:hypothetical protein